ncbi:MAG: hypothetical protein WCA56_18420 [Xanthobacteraceae bacterium]
MIEYTGHRYAVKQRLAGRIVAGHLQKWLRFVILSALARCGLGPWRGVAPLAPIGTSPEGWFAMRRDGWVFSQSARAAGRISRVAG